MIDEPLLEIDDIQGHLVPGFGTRYMRIVGLKIQDTAQFKTQIAPTVNALTSATKALAKRDARKASLMATGERPADPDVLSAMAFSAPGLQRLGVDLRRLKDRRFKRGMAFDAPELGDHTNEDGPVGWVFGADEATNPDVLMLFGCELPDELDRFVTGFIASVADCTDVVLNQLGDRPEDDKEHFGFKDSVSQPAVRGRVSEDRPLYSRYLAETDPFFDLQARPGQALIWPGQFIFGYPVQLTNPTTPGRNADPGTAWMKNGSYLVVRRLSQDVAQFRTAMADQAARLKTEHDIEITPESLAARLVGRWPDGTPVTHSTSGPDATISGNRMRINDFAYERDAAQRILSSGETFTGPPADIGGLRCPELAHIRKINPRDGRTAIGSEFTPAKLILRRGVNFGTRFEDCPDDERGLFFMCYQTSITNQFVFLQKFWGNTHNRPTLSGHDFVIGQTQNEQNRRFGSIPLEGKTCALDFNGRWVTTTGGGYFSVPGIEGVKGILG